MRMFLLLVTASLLEVGGDALIRMGMKGKGLLLVLLGAAALVIYGVFVNLTSLDFGRLMGIYIVLFFVVSQIVAALAFGERISLPVLVGGSLVIGGGVVMAAWRGS